MSGQQDKFEHESLQDAESIVKYLTELSEGIKNNALTLGSSDTQIVLEPKGMLKFRIEAKRKKDKGRLELSISWKEQNGNGERAHEEETEEGESKEERKARKKAAKEEKERAEEAAKAEKKAAKAAAKAERKAAEGADKGEKKSERKAEAPAPLTIGERSDA